MKLGKFLIVSVLIVLTLTSCSPVQQAYQTVVTLLEALRAAIMALSVFVVGWVFAQIGARIPLFEKLFGQYKDEIAFALAGAVVGVIQDVLNTIPAGWEEVANLALMLLVAVLAALQAFRLLGKAGVKSFRSG